MNHLASQKTNPTQRVCPLNPEQNFPEELRALVRELAPEGTHPWAVSFSKFIGAGEL